MALSTRIIVAFVLVLTVLSLTAAEQHWGSFKNNGCVTVKGVGKVRSYSSVLWGIPWGHSWEKACANKDAKVHGTYFRRPSVCVKASVSSTFSALSKVIRVAGIVFKPAKAFGAVLSVTNQVLKKNDWGALNMWGVFYIKDPSCK